METTDKQAVVVMAKTRQVVDGLLERLNLLLYVTIAPEQGTAGLTRSLSVMPESNKPNSKWLQLKS